MRGSDGRGVAVADDDENLAVGLGELDAGGHREGAAVGGAEVVAAPGGEGLPAHAADAGAEDDVILRETQLVDGLQQPVLDHADAAAVTGLGRDLARAQVFPRQRVHTSAGASTAPSEASPQDRWRRQSWRSKGFLVP